MKENDLHYHLYAREANSKYRDEKGLLKAYIESVESMLKTYPFQWFNYFDFWDDIKR
jgi:predicted LPLAT superfamily acyltransferase